MRTLVFKVGSFICHQIPERSIMLSGKLLPVCARCTGIYAGITLSFLLLFITRKRKADAFPSMNTAVFTAFWLLPFMIDGAGSYTGLWETNNLIRILTGAFAGAALPLLFTVAANFSVYGKEKIYIVKNIRQASWHLLVCLAFAAKVYYSAVSYAAVVFVILCGIVLFLISIIRLIFKLVYNREGKENGHA